jgi:hydroxymethylbilane synthase
MTRLLRIATRQSQLALWQANFIRDRLIEAHRDLEVRLVGLTTRGDKWLQSPLSEIGGKGLFVKELEAAMLDGEADIAVHSVKDLPAVLPSEFSLPVVGYREMVNDLLVGATDLSDLAEGARIGSSSLRRKAQLLALRPDLDVQPIRGNVDTRLRKLDDGEFDAIVLAAAGLRRLNVKRQDSVILSTDESLPAPGQGALGIETVANSGLEDLLGPLVDADAARCVRAERGISAGLGADCSLPIAAMAVPDGQSITLSALVAAVDGSRIIRTQVQGDAPEQLAQTALDKLREQGAEEILLELRTGIQ